MWGPESLEGRIVAGYRLGRRLGRGGNAAVFEATNTFDSRIRRAIKVMQVPDGDVSDAKRRFGEEAAAMESMNHPNVVRFHGVREEQGLLFMELELLEGRCLADELAARRPRGPEVGEALGWVLQAALGLGHAHERGLVHRDVSTRNLFLTAQGQVKVLDFGLVALRAAFARLTQDGSTAGSMPYMAPERFGSARGSPATDVYALGLVAAEALLGHHPFEESGEEPLTQAQWVYAHLHRGLPPLSARLGGWSEVDGVLLRATAKNPLDRYADAGAFANAVRGLGAGTLGGARPAASPPGVRMAGAPTVASASGSRDRGLATGSGSSTADPSVLETRRVPERQPGERASGIAAAAPSAAEADRGAKVRPWWGGVADAILTPWALARHEAAARGGYSQGEGSGTWSLEHGCRVVRVPRGTFTMGSPTSEWGRGRDEAPVSVTLSKDFLLMTTPVTQGLYEAVTGENPSHFASRGASCPVEMVSWLDAVAFANALSMKDRLTPVYRISGTQVTANWGANGWRLPTEAEWERAARGGQSTLYAGGNEVDAVAWTGSNSVGTTHAVSTKEPNAYGLCDMSGNVWEWTWDWYGSSLPGGTDPTGGLSGSYRVFRGGSWRFGPAIARVAYRFWSTPDRADSDLGFRLARSAP